MKLNFEPAPHYRSPQSTTSIMKDLTLCLCAVTVYAVIYYAQVYGASYAVRVIEMMVAAVLAACCTEAVYFRLRRQDIKTGIATSYPWVTAMILVLISSIDNSVYAIIASTVIAIVFGKLVFGGFGQNIFNPAAFGEAILMNSFASAKSADFATGATPTTAIKSYGWLLTNEEWPDFIEQYGGLGKMFLGQYPSTIGSTCALLILLCGIFLIIRKDIDWQAPVFYIGTIFVLSLIIGAMHGAGAWYAVYQVLAGGVVFGGIFMLTDPVTSPVTIPGRVVFGIGAACFTLIFRLRSNMADGVLYSILLMNMLTPAIDMMMDGNQIKNAKKISRNVTVWSVCFIIIALLIGGFAQEEQPDTSSDSSSSGSAAALALSDDYSDYEAACEAVGDSTYSCTAKGFGLITGMEGDYKKNRVTITVADGAVESITLDNFGDTAGIGDQAVTDENLANYVGLTLDDSVDAVSGATYTSKSITAMVQAALEAAAQ